MSFKEVYLEDNPFSVRYGRPRTELPMDTVMDLHNKGWTCRDIAKELGKRGIQTSKDTVSRRIHDWLSKNCEGENNK